MVRALLRFSEHAADGYVLGPVRAAVGALLGWQALASARALTMGPYFGDVFHASMLPDAFVPSHRLYAVLVASRICLAVMVALGIWARPALASSALLGTWTLLCDRLQFSHEVYSLHCFALLLSLTPCDRSWQAFEGAVPEPRSGPFWGVHLAQLQVSLVYLASGASKLVDPDWRAGLALADRIAHASLPPGVIWWLSRGDVASALAKIAILTELLLSLALWLRPTRVVAIWWGVWFHLAIQLVASVPTYTILQLATFGLFVTPDHEARSLRFDPSRPWGKLALIAVPLLDWFGRFDLEPWEPDDQRGHSVVVVRRDGTSVTGIRAFAMITRSLPALFPIWAPAALVASFTRQGDLSTRG